MKVSIQTISRKTGFSPATVSNALNGKRGVSKETAEIVCRVAQECGYKIESRIKTIRLVVFHKNGLIIDGSQFFGRIMEGVEQQAKEFGYEILLTHISYGPGYEMQLREIVDDTKSAVIVLGTEMTEEDYRIIKNHKCFLILLDGWSDEIQFDSVLINNTDSARDAVSYLIENGHRRIGYLKGRFRISGFKCRETGYVQEMMKHNLPIRNEDIVLLDTTVEQAYEDMKKYLNKNRDLPTAFFADNDILAVSAMRALKEAGYRIPEDVSMIGFDDLPFGAIGSPPLTTIHVHRAAMGEIVVRRLLDNINYENYVKTKIQVCTELVERKSVYKIKEENHGTH